MRIAAGNASDAVGVLPRSAGLRGYGDNLKRTLGDYYILPPIVDEALLAKVLDYAISVDFGQKGR